MAPVPRPRQLMARVPGTSATAGLGSQALAEHIGQFTDYMLRDRGLSPRTADDRMPDDPGVPFASRRGRPPAGRADCRSGGRSAGEKGPGRGLCPRDRPDLRVAPSGRFSGRRRAGLVSSRLGGRDHGFAGVSIRKPSGRTLLGRRESTLATRKGTVPPTSVIMPC